MAIKIVVGLGFGDETKGATVDYLTDFLKAGLVVRYNGGAQAAHNVVTPDGRHHTFSMFGSGTFAGAKTHLSRFVRVDPMVIWSEAHALHGKGVETPHKLITVDKNAIITTPFHAAHSQYVAPIHKRGTCGLGVGASVRYAEKRPYEALYAGDLKRRDVVVEKLREMAWCYRDAVRNTDVVKAPQTEIEIMADFYLEFAEAVRVTDADGLRVMLETTDDVIFEGAQGFLLDKDAGCQPYVTSSDTTTRQAFELIAEAEYDGEVETIGVMRSYMTRHGAGNFPTEINAGIADFPELHNVTGEQYLQGAFRVGWLDFDLINLAVRSMPVDSIAVSHLDYMENADVWKIAQRVPGDDIWVGSPSMVTVNSEGELINLIERTLSKPVVMRAWGQTREQRSYTWL